jgi:ankyrin repeat protein
MGSSCTKSTDIYEFNHRPIQTRVLQAAASGYIAELADLFENGAHADTFDYDGKSALHLASSAGQFEAVCLLISKRAQVNTKDRWGNEPLKDAISNGHSKVVDILKQHGANLSLECNTELELKLCSLAAQGDLPGVKHMVESGICCNAAGCDRKTAVQVAAEFGHADVVNYLVSMGADVSSHRRNCWVPDNPAAGPDTPPQAAGPTGAHTVGALLEAAAAGDTGQLTGLLALG